MSFPLGDKIRAFILPENAHGVSVVEPDARTLESWAYQADRQADLLRREKDNTHHAVRSNLDLIKRLKEANDKLEAVRGVLNDPVIYDSADEPALRDGIRKILGG